MYAEEMEAENLTYGTFIVCTQVFDISVYMFCFIQRKLNLKILWEFNIDWRLLGW